MRRPEDDMETSRDGAEAAGTHGVGASVERREDPDLITGNAQYTNDIEAPDALHAAIVRSQFGHARVRSIDASAAMEREGVVAVFTAADVEASDAPLAVHRSGRHHSQTGTDFPMLAAEKTLYMGEPVAVVLAEDRYTANDALGDVVVDYDRLDAVTTVEDALDPDAPTLHEQHGDNRAMDWEWGDHEAIEEAFAAADHVVELDVSNQRVIPNAMEPRGALAEYDDEERRLTVRMSTQVPHRARGNFAEQVGIPEHRVRVIAPDVGGGFGSKGAAVYHDEPLVAWCALQVDRPVKWIATRSEAHQTDHHGRDIHARGELALDADGRILGLRVDGRLNLGAYLVWGKTPAWNFRHLLSGQYAVPTIAGHFEAAYTNTAPIAPYRGAGRPESIFLLERLVNRAAAVLDVDPVELRRRNLIPADAFPFESQTGAVYDSGNYERALEKALEVVDYEGWRQRQADLREEDRYVGIGLGCFVENTGTAPGMPETGKIKFRRSGEVVAFCGTADHGQGHGTSFAQVLADELGVDYDDVEIREGDSDDLRDGVGTFGSRSAPVGASALAEAAAGVRAKARRLAADELEADPEDVEFDAGEFHVAGVPDRSIHIQEVARQSYVREDLPEDLEGGLEKESFYDPEDLAYAFGAHVAVVEIDPRSGELSFHDYVAVDDCGVQFNPMIVEGQIHGGLAQGIGQALYEGASYDENGTLLTGSFQDYAMPGAAQLPDFRVEETVTPCPHNPVGAKGVGESGTIGAPPAVVNAAVDALAPFDVETLDMPLTAETLWRAASDGGE